MATSTEDRYRTLRDAALNLLLAYEQYEDEDPYRRSLWDVIEKYDEEDGLLPKAI